MSNKITFSNASNAKLSCKLKQNDKEVTDGISDLRLYMNGEQVELDNENSKEIDLTETASFFVSAKYDGAEISSGTVVAEFERIAMPCYYGTVVFGTYEWESSAADKFIQGLDQDYFDLHVDNNPIMVGEKAIANPGKLVKTFSIVPNEYKYYFYCADEDVEESRIFVAYPKYFGEITKILDGMNNQMEIDKDGDQGFISREIILGDEPYYVFLAKQTNATDASGEPASVTFQK